MLSGLLADEGDPLVDQSNSLSLAADSGPLKHHQKTLLSATNGGPLSISWSRQWLATIYSQCRTDCYAVGGPVVALQSLVAVMPAAIQEQHLVPHGKLLECNKNILCTLIK